MDDAWMIDGRRLTCVLWTAACFWLLVTTLDTRT